MKVGRKKEKNWLVREFLNDPTWYYIGVEVGDLRWLSGALGLEAREAVKAFEFEGIRQQRDGDEGRALDIYKKTRNGFQVVIPELIVVIFNLFNVFSRRGRG